MGNDIDELISILLLHENKIGPILILECRSGMKVTTDRLDKGAVLAYSAWSDDSFVKMLQMAIKNLDDKKDVHGQGFQSC